MFDRKFILQLLFKSHKHNFEKTQRNMEAYIEKIKHMTNSNDVYFSFGKKSMQMISLSKTNRAQAFFL